MNLPSARCSLSAIRWAADDTPSEEEILRNRIFGAIGVLWGGALLVSKVISEHWISGSGAYASGQVAGLVFAVLLFGVGLYYLIKGGSKSPTGGSQPPAA